MDSDNTSASWHPAKMPNSTTHDQHIEAEPHIQTPVVATKDENTTEANVTEDVPAATSPSHDASFDHHEHEGESGASLWDTEEVPTSDAPFSSVPEPAPAGNTSKHASTMSFTRTVSHEVSFNDDEDVEWSLQRSETNPFGFMSENARTNSFPAVPPMENPIAEQLSQPPPASQAGEIVRELEAENIHADVSASDANAVDRLEDGQADSQGEAGGFSQNTVSGDYVGTEQDESDARYEEGLPLISRQKSPETSADVESKPSNPTDLFQDETGDAGDDFFAQVQNHSQMPQDSVLNHALQRKSTNMVIGQNVNSEPPSPVEETSSKSLDGPNASGDGNMVQSPEGGAKVTARTEDLDAKWAAAFGDDDDAEFLLDTSTEPKELDPSDIFGSDDEGFLEDDEDQVPVVSSQAQTAQSNLNGHYAPAPVQQQLYSTPSPYAPAPLVSHIPPAQQRPVFTATNTAPVGMLYGAPLPKPDLPKAQSFVDKSKGGYQSPYDLPMDVVKPKKRASAQHQQQRPGVNATPPAPPTVLPPRSVSMYTQPPPSGGSNPSLSPPGSSHSNQPSSLGAKKSTPQLKSKSSFFEDLPLPSRPRPSSRHTLQPSPTQPPPQAQLHPPVNNPVVPLPARTLLPRTQTVGIIPLVAPERVSPYASLQSDAPGRPQPPSTANNRYSPAPAPLPAANGTGPALIPASRYSPAPPSRGHFSAVPPPVLSHQPRTSSPLAHFEVSHAKSESKLASPVNGGGAPLLRASSSQYEHRATRVPSLPPTQEVEEEQSQDSSIDAAIHASSIPQESRYAPMQARRTPPPLGIHPSNPLSPPKRALSSYTPQPEASITTKESNFSPPPRSQTQSPGAVYGNRGVTDSFDSGPRPSSAHAPTSPRQVSNTQPSRPTGGARGISQHINLSPPTDGRELDPLQRWQGAPSIAWGIGGLFISSFPKDVPRYNINSNIPQITRSPGEVKVKHMKDILPLEEKFSKFPGPLKGKSKKKEVIAWLTAGIDDLERNLPNVGFQQQVSHENKRAAERLLLWKILRVLVENDGILEGNPAVEKAVRDVITPGLDTANPEISSATTATAMQADAANSTTAESIRRHLLLGDREKAVWTAVDNRLWGHAFLLSNSMQNPELYRKVAQEFIRKEVNHAGHGNESLAALYSVLSGSFEEAVDELVPAHARAGLQLISTSASGASHDVLAGLDKWRETLGMILNNRRQGDGQALRSLGDLLSGYGRADAAHICYIFARNFAVFSGLDDPNANFVLVGADHRRQVDQFAKESEALQLSEVYEYGLSLAPSSNIARSCSHLAAYKLNHALVLAEHGLRDKALQYCEGIWNSITSQPKNSPYSNPMLASAVEDLMTRLKQTAGEETSSWITKPKMDQVSSNIWSRFNKFVAGDDDNGNGNGAPGDGGAEVGPFARIAGGTPTVSRSPSVSNFEMYGSSPSMPTNQTSSYAPQYLGSPYEPARPFNSAARSSMERTSSELQRSPYDLARRGSDTQSTNANPYAPVSLSSSVPPTTYQPLAPTNTETSPYAPASQSQPTPASKSEPSNIGYPGYQPYGSSQTSEGNSTALVEQNASNTTGLDSGYQPPSYGGYEQPSTQSHEPPTAEAGNSTGGYEPPSYQPSSFEPPSYEPGPMEDDEAVGSRPKKSFMDEDDDDLPGLKPKEKTKAEKDRENEELVRRVAEEEEKRAAEAKAAKKGWGFGGWFGGKKEPAELPNKPIKAKLGEASSFVYDPDLKRWVNKKQGAENTPAKTATPPPPRAASTPPTSMPPTGASSAPPMGMMAPPPPRPTPPPMKLNKAVSQESLNAHGGAPLMARTISNQSNASMPGGPQSAPPSRPATSLSNASSIDDLLGAAGPRKGARKPRKSGRYVDVMAK